MIDPQRVEFSRRLSALPPPVPVGEPREESTFAAEPVEARREREDALAELETELVRRKEEIERLRAAVAEQDTHWFTEPPPWYFPVRHALGAVLVQAGHAAAAEQVYREDLVRNPGNGWALFGLTQALRAQGKSDAAQQAEVRFGKAWVKADVTLKASRF